MAKFRREKIMRKAWRLARAGAERFGGTVKQYLSSSLSICWSEEKALAMEEEAPRLVWRLGIGAQFVLPGAPLPASGVKKGQRTLPGFMA